MFFTLVLFTPLLRADQLTVLGSADTFAVFGSSAVTNTGSTALNGNIGVFGNTPVSGFSSVTVTGGAVHVTDSLAIGAQSDAANAYIYLHGLAFTQDLTGQDLGGLTLNPGVYSFTSSAQLTGTLTLDFQGLSNVNIIIQTVSTLITASNSNVVVINQGVNDNVYYQVGSSATLGTDSTFAGDILASDSITLNTGASITCGSAIAVGGAVTLDANAINNCSSTGSDVTAFAPTVQPPSTVPEPGTFGLLITGLLGGAGMFRRKIAV